MTARTSGSVHAAANAAARPSSESASHGKMGVSRRRRGDNISNRTSAMIDIAQVQGQVTPSR